MRMFITTCMLFLTPLTLHGAAGPNRSSSGGQGTSETSTRGGLLWRSRRVCGVNCTYLLIKYFNKSVDYWDLESKLLRQGPTSMLEIQRAIKASGLACDIVKTNRSGLMSLPKPVIAHLEFVSGKGKTGAHFIVVTRADPAKGISCIDGTTASPRTMTWAMFERDWSGHLIAVPDVSSPALPVFVVLMAVGLLLGCVIGRARPSPQSTSPVGRAISKLFRNNRSALVLGMVLSGSMRCAAEVPSLETITRSYQTRYQGVKTLRADYLCQGTALVSQARLYEIQGIYEMVPSKLSLAIAADGRIYHSSKTTRHHGSDINRWLDKSGHRMIKSVANHPPYAEVAEALREVAPRARETVDVFDGARLIHRVHDPRFPPEVNHPAWSIIYITRLNSAYFAESPLDLSLWAFRCPALPYDDQLRRKHRIPEIFENGRFTVASAMENVGGDPCIVVSDPGNQTLWLLPDRGFAPRKREFYFRGQLRGRTEFSDWNEVDQGSWIARRIVGTAYGVKDFHPKSYEGVPLTRTTYSLRKLEINNPETEKFLSVEFEAGDLIIDENLAAEERRGKTIKANKFGQSVLPTVSYEVPAKKEDLDRAIKSAVAEDRRRHGSSSWRAGSLILINLVGVVLMGAIILVRRHRRS